MTNLQRIRKQRGLTQAELAELSGVNLRMIQKYESGEKNINHAQFITIYKLSFALDCLTDALLIKDEEAKNALFYLQDNKIEFTAQNGTN